VKPVDAGIVGVQMAGGRRAAMVAADYLTLTKPRLNMLVVATSAGGYYLGAAGTPGVWPLLQAVAGTTLVAGGAAALNQVYERDTDALMRRTRIRPLPDGRVSWTDARLFGWLLAAAGLTTLLFVNVLSAVIALTTLLTYLALYTPLKRRSPHATLVGAIPGALPPLIGWTAATGATSLSGWALFAIVFLWQIPHFMAIAWMYREDYARAGFPMLPVVEPDGRRAGRHAFAYALALVPASLIPSWTGIAGWPYFWTAAALGLALVALAARFSSDRSDRTARALFYGSITYLPLLWVAMILDH
jgi:protoheme IX farnesyltransferase